MQTLLFESAVRATLIAAIVALVLYVMRIKTAAARHAVWASVVLVMMLLPAWVAWGPKAPLPFLPPAAGQTASAMPAVDLPVGAPVATPSPTTEPKPSAWSWATFLLGVYFVGLCALLTRLAIGTIRAGRLTSVSCVVPVTVGLLRPRVILPQSFRGWPQRQLEAVLTHEGEHARRHDPLFQWLALLNRAIFWFHPLAWWLERWLSGLAEEACDAAVLARGHDPRDYSEYLLDLARSVERAGSRIDALGMAMPGAFLPERIRRMLSGVSAPRTSRPRMACAVAMCAIAAALLAAGTLVRAQSDVKDQKGPVFEVASVKRAGKGVGSAQKSKSGGGGFEPPTVDHDRFTYNGSLFNLVVGAYGVQGCTAPGFQLFDQDCSLISGGPAWFKNERFSIQAKMPKGTPNYTFNQLRQAQAPQLQLMLQALLADRFNLKIHRETKQLQTFALTLAKKDPRLKPAAGNGDGFGPIFNPNEQPNGQVLIKMTAQNLSMREFAGTLSNLMFRPVTDRTGLAGKFDFAMEYERDPDTPDTPNTPPAAQLTGPAFFSGLQQQLGLRVESIKGPVEVLVIDHAEMPSAN